MGLNDRYSSPNIVRVMKNEKNKMDRPCSTYGGAEVYTGFCWGNLRGRGHLEDQGRDERIILRRIFRKWHVGTWTESMSQDRD